MDNSDLAVRMKKYEAVSKNVLMRRTPVILRLDGKSFHSFTKGFVKPFDEVFVTAMHNTMLHLCEKIQGCVLGYTQSDEITLVLVDYQKLNTGAWFDYEVQKLCSVTAAMATLIFNDCFEESMSNFFDENTEVEFKDNKTNVIVKKGAQEQYNIYCEAIYKGAIFDCRAFNIPKEEVANNIYWRQLDATRNSIQALGQAHFSHKELQKKSCNDIQNMLFTQKGINWSELPTRLKRGCCCIKESKFYPDENGNDYYNDGSGDVVNGTYKHYWVIDGEIPVFKGDGRNYIDKLVFVGE